MPIDLYESNTEVIKDIIYVVGGWRKSGGTYFTSNSTFAYDPEGGSWKTRKNCPVITGTN